MDIEQVRAMESAVHTVMRAQKAAIGRYVLQLTNEAGAQTIRMDTATGETHALDATQHRWVSVTEPTSADTVDADTNPTYTANFESSVREIVAKMLAERHRAQKRARWILREDLVAQHEKILEAQKAQIETKIAGY